VVLYIIPKNDIQVEYNVTSERSASAAASFKLIIFQNDIRAQLRNTIKKWHSPGGLLEAVVRFSIIFH